MIRIITDSASDIVDNGREDLTVLPINIRFGDDEFQDGVNLTHRMFYEKLVESDELPVTSQVPPFVFEEAYEAVKAQGDQAIVITISSKLSGTYQSAVLAAEGCGDSVRVVDSENASIGQRALVEYALKLKDAGLDYESIVERLEAHKNRIRLVALLDTLEYLKKGGRVTPAAAAIGTVLNLKPVLQIQGEKLDSYAKVRGWKAAKKAMLDAAGKDLNGRFAGKAMHIHAAHTCSEEEAQEWKKEIEAAFPGYDIHMDRLSLSVSCHIGAGSKAIACIKKVEY